ncbi:MAG TPA: TfoX/Sxy family protein [Pseudomonadales bacterium]|nr:TfoX/Sxy family protein [Pseudomonadales bacterium]
MTEDKKLIELKNIGASTVNILNSIGIHSQRELKAIGSAQAYRRIRQQGVHVSRALLYAMEGALLDIPWQSLDSALKAQLVQMAERIYQEETESEKLTQQEE